MSNLQKRREQYAAFQKMDLNLNIERGQPADQNFELCSDLLSAVDHDSVITDAGVDIRNYPGGILGLIEARQLFSEQIRVSPDEIMIGNNSSLDMMSSFLSWALLRGVYGSKSSWLTNIRKGDKPKLIVTVPGYDRHFGLAAELGYELLTVDMTKEGPDMDQVEALAGDPDVKGIYFVPRYSNPTGDSISRQSAIRLVGMHTAAPDFTVFADDAYAVHHLDEEPEVAPNLLKFAQDAGNSERVILFGSTSKITFASGGLCFAGMSQRNLEHWSRLLSHQSIGPNKIEQWRHVRFLRQYPGGLTGLMRDHAKILKPKFDAVQEILNAELSPDVARWTDPKGGYFVSVDTDRPVAARVIELAGQAGVALTPVGATYPEGIDPTGCNIRLAPSRPPLEEVELAMNVFACCVNLATEEYDSTR
ncbi:MAG: aminotransferase class I/II-fold pyridoxal phosphate-dependent enzyme [Granulosicoccus sp.]|nr:aminotransferase class I/II-fold pyridoxal phosphate-dependent enzyme [Granulosicoccus sp.]